MPNDYTITNGDLLYRRFYIKTEPAYVSFWKLAGDRKIPSSAAFKTKRDENGLSVNIASLTTPEGTVEDPAAFAVAEFPASVPLNAGYKCVQDEQPGNVAHALILGDTQSIAKKMSRSVTRVFEF